VFVRPPPFTEAAARQAIENSVCWSDALRRLGYVPKGHNIRTLQKHARRWRISTDHFDPHVGRRRAGISRALPLSEILVEGSLYSRGHLKRRLYTEGIKERLCEMCGQGETWRGRRMALVLDHINGVSNDHRLENLQILCPNCAATLETHCGRNVPHERKCAGLSSLFANHDPSPLLLARVLSGTAARGTAPRAQEGPAARLRSALCRGGGERVSGYRPEVRRVRQRDPQVGEAVRVGAVGVVELVAAEGPWDV
jgi:hypothetical protein